MSHREKKSYRVMIIDDDEFILDTLNAGVPLYSEEITLIGCRSGAECFTVLENLIPDAVVLDMGLPDADGIDMVKQLRHRLMHIPIIILSGNDEPEKKTEAMQAGADGYYLKPVPPAQLVRILEYHLNRTGWVESLGKE